jgi:hypothetical protein
MGYPIVEPFDSGILEAGSGHRVFWERVGNRTASRDDGLASCVCSTAGTATD